MIMNKFMHLPKEGFRTSARLLGAGVGVLGGWWKGNG